MKTPPKALGVKTQTEPSHSWLSGLLLPGQTADPPAERLLGRPQHVPGRRRRNAPLVPAPPTARSHGARQPEIIPGQPSLPGNRQDLWGLQGLRDRSRCSAEAWWRRFAGKYAVAVAFVGARKGPDRIAPHSGYNCSACLTGRTSCSLATTLLNSRGAPGNAPIPSKRATHWHHPAFPCSIPRTCIESNPAPIIQIRRGRRSRRIADPQHGRSQLRSMGAAGAPDTKELLVVAILHSLPYPGACLDSSLRIAGASHPDAAAGQDAGKVRSAILGPGPTSHSSASILYFCAASQGACDFQIGRAH